MLPPYLSDQVNKVNCGLENQYIQTGWWFGSLIEKCKIWGSQNGVGEQESLWNAHGVYRSLVTDATKEHIAIIIGVR